MPVRQRLVARTRLIAFAGAVLVITLALGLSWVVSRRVGTGSTFWLDALHLGAFVLLAVLAWVFARRTSQVIEALFREEDRMMLAVVHEASRPLSRLVAAVDEGLAEVEPPEVALRRVAVEAGILSELIEELLEAARVATGAIPLADEEVHLDEVARDLERSDALGEAALAFDTVPAVVIGSPRLVRLALVNLVRNAAQHAYAGGPGTIEVRVDDRGVAVVDDGPGMDPAQLEELHRRKSWVGLRRARVRMGLAIAVWAAEVHGGGLELANRPGGGLEARLALPVEPRRSPRSQTTISTTGGVP